MDASPHGNITAAGAKMPTGAAKKIAENAEPSRVVVTS
jgi:hypothetical protein